MKPNKADKDMWLRARIANQMLKQNVLTQDADGMQAFCVKHGTVTGFISTLLYFMGV